MKRRLLSLSFVAFGLGVAACQPCDADACMDSLRVIIREPGGGGIVDGIYDIEIVTSAAQYEGTCTISGSSRNAACEGFDSVLSLPKFGSVDAPHEEIWIDFPDWSMSDTQDSGLPDEVQVRISAGGESLLDETLQPNYEVRDETCHPECVSDQIELSLSR